MCLLILSDKTSTLPNGNPNGEFNMGLEVPTSSPPKLSPTEITSPNPNIKSNFDFGLQVGFNSNQAKKW